MGLGLVALALTGRRSGRGGLIALGAVLSLALITVSTVDVPASGVGDRTYRPATAAEVREVYSGGLGDVTVDLSLLDQGISGDPVTTRIEHGVGDLEVVLPRSADVRLEIEHGLGDVDVFDRGSETEGFFPGIGSSSWTDDGEPEFILSINSGVGDVEVSRG
ncbi:LiaF domain-containing protein [Blastococcus brunescens]|uniref:LiaF domain-containing protein n=1 Tax=Blastococcus brunescens TaxID=1564165 RepID=A0ABZ1B8S5_9ACTN|nr:LiaF domain-containing protein [Blastococcus sp. BMG 8361]WRL67139.1 LiaF domain-containing protein [Blastococcus sp. BMG 8361]